MVCEAGAVVRALQHAQEWLSVGVSACSVTGHTSSDREHATLDLLFVSGGVTASTCVVATVYAPFRGRFCSLSRRTFVYRKVNMPHTGCDFMRRMMALFQGTKEMAQWVREFAVKACPEFKAQHHKEARRWPCVCVPSGGLQKQCDPGSSLAIKPGQDVELRVRWDTLSQVNKAERGALLMV